MGYSELNCHLCGVSFNIGRLRAIGEPRQAAWGNESGDYIAYSQYSDCGSVSSEDEAEEPSQQDQETSPGGHAKFQKQTSDCCYLVNRKSCKPHAIQMENGKIIRPTTSDGDIVMTEASDPADTEVSSLNAATRQSQDDDEDDLDFRGSDPETSDPLEYDSNADDDGSEEGANQMDYERTSEVEHEWRNRPDYTWSDESRNLPGVQAFWSKVYDSKNFPNQQEQDQGRGRLLSWYDTSDHEKVAAEGEEDHPQEFFYPLLKDDHYIDSLNLTSGPSREYSPGPEHIAGRACRSKKGYLPHRVTFEEMQGCKILQCLARKTQERRFQPLGDEAADIVAGPDEEFELHGDFFLTGLCDEAPSRDMSDPEVFPHRHGVADLPADNHLYHEDTALETGMPFHPWCLEIYKRLSHYRHVASKSKGAHQASSAVLDLCAWWSFDAGLQRFDTKELHGGYSGDVYRNSDQWWAHVEGTEYLATNPLYIPGLQDILRSAISTDAGFDVRNCAFPSKGIISSGHGPSLSTARDPFALIPSELRMAILADLAPRDIARLRLVSRSFNDLPISFFHSLIKREMPWLWEAWGDSSGKNALPAPQPYSIWTRTSPLALKRASEVFNERRRAAVEYVQIVTSEYPELQTELLEERRKWELADSRDFARSVYGLDDSERMPFVLPPSRTDWYQLYCALTRELGKGQLKGLRNRARIWGDCGRIIDKMDEERQEGMWPVEDVVGQIEQAYELARIERERHQREREAERSLRQGLFASAV